MKLAETIKEILLAFSIAIMVPVLSYWGVQAIYNNNKIEEVVGSDSKTKDQTIKQTSDMGNLTLQNLQEVKKISFWVYLVVAFLAICPGAFIADNSLSMGLIGGGVFNILGSIVNSPNSPIINLSIFLLLFITLILLIVFRKKQ